MVERESTMTSQAYCIARTFPAGAERRLQRPDHYVIYCTQGVLRLRTDGRVWPLPAARAAIVRAGEPVDVSLPCEVTTCSVVFRRGFVDAPEQALAVVDMSALARELMWACRRYGENDHLDGYGHHLFQLLARELARLAGTPSVCSLPLPRSAQVRRALARTEADMADAPDFARIAREVALSPRTLARRFAVEMGMPWRQVLRTLRMIRAMELLARPHASVTDVALSVGYASLSGFSAAFREFAGQTPGGYQESLRPDVPPVR